MYLHHLLFFVVFFKRKFLAAICPESTLQFLQATSWQLWAEQLCPGEQACLALNKLSTPRTHTDLSPLLQCFKLLLYGLELLVQSLTGPFILRQALPPGFLRKQIVQRSWRCCRLVQQAAQILVFTSASPGWSTPSKCCSPSGSSGGSFHSVKLPSSAGDTTCQALFRPRLELLYTL